MPTVLSFRCERMPSGTPTSTKQMDASAKAKRLESSTLSELSWRRRYSTSCAFIPFSSGDALTFSISARVREISASTPRKARSLVRRWYFSSLRTSFST